MKRVATDQLEAIAHAERAPIEVDHEQQIAVVAVGRSVWYARLEPGMEPCS